MPASDLSHLQVSPSIRALWNYKIRRLIAFILFKIPIIMKIVGLLESTIIHLKNIDRANRQTKDFIKNKDGESANKFGSGFGYESEFREIEVAEMYRNQVQKNTTGFKCESKVIYNKIIDYSAIMLEDKNITKLLNFGISYGHIDSILAESFPDVKFSGIDRSELTKFYNEKYLNNSSVSFHAGDIFEFMSNNWQNAALMHIRTLTCLPRNFVDKLYYTAKKNGFKWIMGLEQCGLSWQTGEHYEFSTQHKESVILRNYMFIHNYPAILKNMATI